MVDLDQEKQSAARDSLRFVKDGDVVGLGTGSTATHMIFQLGERVKAGLRIRGIPTSERTAQLACSIGIQLTTLQETPRIDVTIDGADEIDPRLRLIKGGGGALVREKQVARASRQLVIIGDSTKQVAVLGKFPLPVAVVPSSDVAASQAISALGASVQVRHQDQRLFVTDAGHHILDCHFGQIADPEGLAKEIQSIPGVVDHGLFLDMADVALIARGEAILELKS